MTYNDIYELNAANQAALKDETIHDALTGLMNRRGFDNLQNILRTNSPPLALVVADVDTFKQINDRYGHDTGDRVLQRVASLLTSIFRSSDYVVRLGGDEFAVIIHGMGRENLSTLKEKLQTLNHALMNPDGDLPPASVSAGVAFSSNGFSDELYRQADQALYYVKEHGRCGYHVWEPDETQN